MNRKLRLKISIDLLMTVLLFALMAYPLTGQRMHEWMGIVMAVLIALHVALNGPWVKNLFKGRYTAVRAVRTAVNAILAAAFLGLMVSGIGLSRHAFAAPILGGRGFARSLHHVSAYWAFVGASMHLGLRWNMMMGILRKAFRLNTQDWLRTTLLRAAAALTAAAGVYAFIKHQLGAYMLNLIAFAFFDYDQPAALFILEYISVMGLFAALAHYLGLWLQKSKTRE